MCCTADCKSVELCKQPVAVAVAVTGRCLHCACLLCVVTINSLVRTIITDNGSTSVTATHTDTTLSALHLVFTHSHLIHCDARIPKYLNSTLHLQTLTPLLPRPRPPRCNNTATPRLTTIREL